VRDAELVRSPPAVGNGIAVGAAGVVMVAGVVGFALLPWGTASTGGDVAQDRVDESACRTWVVGHQAAGTDAAVAEIRMSADESAVLGR